MKLRTTYFAILAISLGTILSPTPFGCGGGGTGDNPVAELASPEPLPDLDSDGIPDATDSDADGDGIANTADCNDMDGSISPDSIDAPDENTIDQNCDGVDGDKAQAIWVSIQEGDNLAAGTFDAPVKSLAKGIQLAVAKPESERIIYVVEGVYAEDISISDTLSIFGGYGLMNNGTRERNLVNKRAIISGIDNAQIKTIKFNTIDTNIASTLLISDANPIVDGFIIKGDADGIAIQIENAGATIKNSIIEEAKPSAAIDFNLGALITNGIDGSWNPSVHFINDTIIMQGTEKPSGSKDFGIGAFTSMGADSTLTLFIDRCAFESSGTAEYALGIYVASDDNDPSDARKGDGRGNIDLSVTSSSFDMNGTADAVFAIASGYTMGDVYGPDPDSAFTGDFTASKNTIEIKGSAIGHVAINAGLASGGSITNNSILVKGNGNMAMGIVSAMSGIDIANNSIAIQGSAASGIAIARTAFPNKASMGGYADIPIGITSNNITSVSSSTSSKCILVGIMEQVIDGHIDQFNFASSPEIKNNAMYMGGSCVGDKYIYSDQKASNPTEMNLITEPSDLNGKVGFQTSDPSIISGNISADPLFTDQDKGDLSLNSASPCIDGGITIPSIIDDIRGTERLTGSAFDIGAFEM